MAGVLCIIQSAQGTGLMMDLELTPLTRQFCAFVSAMFRAPSELKLRPACKGENKTAGWEAGAESPRSNHAMNFPNGFQVLEPIYDDHLESSIIYYYFL